jgi:UDP-3-O-[3-hydroxymyristoyl] glucosamine N-acyltransferase
MGTSIITLHEIARAVGAEMPSGADPAMHISGANSLDQARSGHISFYESPKYLRALRATKADVVLVPSAFEESLPQVVLRVANPSAAFDMVLDRFAPTPLRRPCGIHPTAIVHDTAEVDPSAGVEAYAVIEAGARVGARSVIGAHVFVGRDSRIGEDCHVYPHAVLREGTILGARVVIQSHAVLGSDGFGYRFAEGRHHRLAHRGCVQIDDDVEIGACTTIDRARFGRTWIQMGTKIDNLVQIAHNVVIGPHCLIIAQTGISGSARLGRYVTLAGQVGVVSHADIGDQVVVAAKGGVSKDVPAKQQLMGTYGIAAKEARELVAHYRRLPKTAAKIKKLEHELEELRSVVAALAGKT